MSEDRSSGGDGDVGTDGPKELEGELSVGFVVYGGLDTVSGGYRYDRKLVSFLRAQGDRADTDTDTETDLDVEVDVVELPWPRETEIDPVDGLEYVPIPRGTRERLNRSFDVLIQDELCHPSLWQQNPTLDGPKSIVALVHHLRAEEPDCDRVPVVRATERRYLESVDAVVCASEVTRDRVTDLVTKPTLVAPPAGRVEGTALSAEQVTVRATEEPLRIVFVGNVIPRKGVLTLLDGLALLESESDCERAWHLALVGSHESDPEYVRAVIERISALGVADRVHVTGTLSNDELHSILERSHVLAVPSHYEGFGMVYLEAMEYGVVPVATTAGGASEFVADGENGLLVPPDTPEVIRKAVDALRRDRQRLARLGCGALETADVHPTWGETFERVLAFLLTEEWDSRASEAGPIDGRGGRSSEVGHRERSNEADHPKRSNGRDQRRPGSTGGDPR